MVSGLVAWTQGFLKAAPQWNDGGSQTPVWIPITEDSRSCRSLSPQIGNAHFQVGPGADPRQDLRQRRAVCLECLRSGSVSAPGYRCPRLVANSALECTFSTRRSPPGQSRGFFGQQCSNAYFIDYAGLEK